MGSYIYSKPIHSCEAVLLSHHAALPPSHHLTDQTEQEKAKVVAALEASKEEGESLEDELRANDQKIANLAAGRWSLNSHYLLHAWTTRPSSVLPAIACAATDAWLFPPEEEKP